MRFHCWHWLTHIFLRAQLKPEIRSSYRYFHRKCLVVNYTSFLFFKLFQPSASRPYSPLASGGGKCCLLHSAIDNEPVLHSKWPKHFDLSSYFPELICTLIKNISLVLYVSVYEFMIFSFSFQFHQTPLQTVEAVKLLPMVCQLSLPL